MFASRVISFNNGWHILSQEKTREWQEIKDTLLEMTPEIMVAPSSYVKDESAFSENNDRLASAYLDKLWDALILRKGWESGEEIRQSGVIGFSIKNCKNKVSSKLLSTILTEDEIYRLLFVTAPRSHKLCLCDVNVALIAPMTRPLPQLLGLGHGLERVGGGSNVLLACK